MTTPASVRRRRREPIRAVIGVATHTSTPADEAAALLKLRPQTVVDYIRAGRLPGRRVAHGVWIVTKSAEELQGLRHDWDLREVMRRRTRGVRVPHMETYLDAAQRLALVHPDLAPAEEQAYRQMRQVLARQASPAEVFVALERWRDVIQCSRAQVLVRVSASIAGIPGCAPAIARELRRRAQREVDIATGWSQVLAQVIDALPDRDVTLSRFVRSFEIEARRALRASGDRELLARCALPGRWKWFYGRTDSPFREEWTRRDHVDEAEAWFAYHLARGGQLVAEMHCAVDTSAEAFLELKAARARATEIRARYRDATGSITRRIAEGYRGRIEPLAAGDRAARA